MMGRKNRCEIKESFKVVLWRKNVGNHENLKQQKFGFIVNGEFNFTLF